MMMASVKAIQGILSKHLTPKNRQNILPVNLDKLPTDSKNCKQTNFN